MRYSRSSDLFARVIDIFSCGEVLVAADERTITAASLSVDCDANFAMSESISSPTFVR